MTAFQVIVRSAIGLGSLLTSTTSQAPKRAHAERPPAFASSVVEKADRILQEAGLRRSGQSLQAIDGVELAREITSVQRRGREVRLVQKTLENSEAQFDRLELRIKELDTRDQQLNLQLAQIAGGDVTANNKIVAMINATRATKSQIRSQRTEMAASLDQMRGEVHEAESNYAELVFQLQASLKALRESVGKQLRDSNVQIAIDVMHRNFDVAKDVSAESITSTLQKRISELAADVFQESIKLESQGNGGLMVSASINRRPIRMVIDTGASVIALPSTAIATLELNVPADAPTRDVRLANGQRIQARSVQLPTVRVGAFQAEDVTAIILGPEAANTPPLLGMSFLKRFKFELDAAKKELRLLRVQ